MRNIVKEAGAFNEIFSSVINSLRLEEPLSETRKRD